MGNVRAMTTDQPETPAASANQLMPPDLYRYYSSIAYREGDHEKALRQATERLPQAFYQLTPEQGQLLKFLIEVAGARRFLEVGTFTGYSALIAAQTMGPTGHVDTLDIDTSYVDVGRPHWEDAGVTERITVHIGPALETLEKFGRTNPYDLALIDADKENYRAYYEHCHSLVRPGGIIAIDNTLWRGRVADPTDSRERTVALRTLNEAIRDDDRVTAVVLPMGDGLTLARKKVT